jgi:hypothetical protein
MASKSAVGDPCKLAPVEHAPLPVSWGELHLVKVRAPLDYWMIIHGSAPMRTADLHETESPRIRTARRQASSRCICHAYACYGRPTTPAPLSLLR